MQQNKIRIFNKYTDISREELIQKYQNDSNLNDILSIFDKISKSHYASLSLDKSSVDIANFFTTSHMLGMDITSIDADNNFDISDDEIKVFLKENSNGKNLNTNFDAFKKFLTAISDKENNEIEHIAKEYDMPIDLVRSLNAKQIWPNEVQKQQGEDGEILYNVPNDVGYRLFNNKGELIEKTEINTDFFFDTENKDSWNTYKFKKNDNGWTNTYVNSKTGLKTEFEFDTDGNKTKRTIQTQDMLIEQSFKDGQPKTDKIQLCDENGGLIEMQLSYDENGVINGINVSTIPGKIKSDPIDNVVFEYECEPPKISDELISKLIETMKNGGVIHNDFDIKIENGEVKLAPRITKEVCDKDSGCFYYVDVKIPSKLEDRMMELIRQGYKYGVDFKINEYENGGFDVQYLSGEILDYECDNKTEFYNENGELLNEIRNHSATENFINNTVQDFSNQNLIPEIHRTIINKNSFIETINGVNYEVKFENKKLIIKRDNQEELNIDVSSLKQNFVQKVLMQVNAKTLYHIAKNKTVIKYSNLSEGLNGEYEPKTNTLYLNRRISNIDEFKRVIAHESGHMFDTKDDKEYATEVIKDMIKTNPKMNTKGESLDKLLEKHGTRQLASRLNQQLINTINNEMQKSFKINISIAKADDPGFTSFVIKGHILSNYMQGVDINNLYALESVEEFFAEAYSLIVSGNCKSAELLCTYFPESLKLIKEIIEESD